MTFSHGLCNDAHDDQLQRMIEHQREQDRTERRAAAKNDFRHGRAVHERFFRPAEQGRNAIFAIEFQHATGQRNQAVHDEKEHDQQEAKQDQFRERITGECVMRERIAKRRVDDQQHDQLVETADRFAVPCDPAAESRRVEHHAETDRQHDDKHQVDDAAEQIEIAVGRCVKQAHPNRRDKNAEDARKTRVENRRRNISACERNHDDGRRHRRRQCREVKQTQPEIVVAVDGKYRIAAQDDERKSDKRAQLYEDVQTKVAQVRDEFLAAKSDAVKEENDRNPVMGRRLQGENAFFRTRPRHEPCQQDRKTDGDDETVDADRTGIAKKFLEE